jgi:tetratricopeptide (TPR) repeat protein
MRRGDRVLFLLVFSFLIFICCCSGTKKTTTVPQAASKDPLYYYQLGDEHFKAGRLIKAIAAFKRSIELDPGNAVSHNYLGFAYFFNRQYEEAISAFEKAIELSPNYADVYNNLGMVYQEIGEIAKAKDAFRRALQFTTYPNPERPYFNLGKIAIEEGDYEEAEFLFRKVISVAPGMAEAHERLGFALEQMGKIRKALDEYGKAVELKPQLPLANFHLGNLYFQLREYDKAKRYLYEVISIVPGSNLSREARTLINRIKKLE